MNAPSKGSRPPSQPVTGEVIARLAKSLRAQSTKAGNNIDAFLAHLTTVIAEYVPGTRHAGIVFIGRDRQIHSQSATDIRPLIIDGIQQRCRCGPSLDVDDGQPTCRVDDFGAETRWPTFVQPVLACSPIQSMLAIQLFSLDGVKGVLNLYAAHPAAFSVDTMRVAEVFAAETILVVQQRSDSSELLEPPTGIDPVEHASLTLMSRYDIDRIAAYSLLVRLAMGSGHTVAAVARRLFPT